MATESLGTPAPAAKFSEKRYHVFSAPAYILFSVILFFPVSQNTLMGWLIAIVTALIGVGFLLGFKMISLNRTIFIWGVYYVILGICFTLIGLKNGNPGARFSTLVFVIWPVVYLLFISSGTNSRIITNLLRVMVVTTIAIGLATIGFALRFSGYLPEYMNLDIIGFNMTTKNGFTEMAVYNLSSLVFLVPFLITSLLVYNRRQRPFIGRKWIWLALFLGIIAVLLGGRRALLLVTLIAPFLGAFFMTWLPGKMQLSRKLRVLISSVALIILAFFSSMVVNMAFDWNWHGVTTAFLDGFDFQSDQGANARAEQYNALVDGWRRNPVIGAGFGATTGYVRSDDRPWEYELQYVMLLFNTGVAGFVLYSAGIVWIYRKAYQMIRSGSRMSIHMVPVLVGTTCFLIANATNPYLETFGHLWTIFLPVALLNYWLLTRTDEDEKPEPAAVSAGTQPTGTASPPAPARF